jgi:hypothetical protein
MRIFAHEILTASASVSAWQATADSDTERFYFSGYL